MYEPNKIQLLELITRVLPSLLVGIAQVGTILVLQSIDELLRNRTIHVTVLYVRCSLGVESLGTLNQQSGTSQLIPTVPLT